jgi:hypothetical protein
LELAKSQLIQNEEFLVILIIEDELEIVCFNLCGVSPDPVKPLGSSVYLRSNLERCFISTVSSIARAVTSTSRRGAE